MSNLSALKVIAFTYLISICMTIQAQHRHALLVGISEYAHNSGWTDIHGKNDINLVRQALSDTQIAELTGRNATYANIVHKLETLEKECAKAILFTFICQDMANHLKTWTETKKTDGTNHLYHTTQSSSMKKECMKESDI